MSKTTFISFYNTHVDDLFSFCIRKTSDRELAKKITEASFKKMWDYVSPDYTATEDENNSTLFAIASRLLRQQNIVSTTTPQFNYSL
jgi:hypothetical protein